MHIVATDCSSLVFCGSSRYAIDNVVDDDDEVCGDDDDDDEDGEEIRRRLETSRLLGVMKACATSEQLLLGEGAVIRTNSMAIEASMVGPGVINDRERFPLLLPVAAAAAAAVDVILLVR